MRSYGVIFRSVKNQIMLGEFNKSDNIESFIKVEGLGEYYTTLPLNAFVGVEVYRTSANTMKIKACEVFTVAHTDKRDTTVEAMLAAQKFPSKDTQNYFYPVLSALEAHHSVKH